MGFSSKTKSAEEIVKHLTTLICTWGPPNCPLSDMGKEFLNIIVNKLYELFQIIRRHTSLADENPASWSNQLDIVLLAYRTTDHSSTNYSFYLMFGRQFCQFDDWLVKEKIVNDLAIENCLSQIKQLFYETHEAARRSQTKAPIKCSDDFLPPGSRCKLMTVS
jgi:hypothetical protein